MAEVLRRCGLRVGHETVFSEVGYRPELWPEFDGEISHAAAQVWDEVPADWPVLHVVRHPVAIIRSMVDLEALGFGSVKGAATHVVEWSRRCVEAVDRGHPFLRVNADRFGVPELQRTFRHVSFRELDVGAAEVALRLRRDYNSGVERLPTFGLESTVTLEDVYETLGWHPLRFHVEALAAAWGYDYHEVPRV